ncbi:hypothetical protein AAE478_002727 [Parahypoxylon ruwenzoriense]
MSKSQPKITSKNLSYSNDLPPFLARLHGQQAQQRDSDAPDPILAARRRAARPRSASEEAEDAPLVVDEAGNAVSFPAADSKTGEGAGGEEDKRSEKEREGEKERVAGIGAGKKRKVGRVVGGGNEEEENENESANGEERRVETTPARKNNKQSADAKQTKKKKAKKIKLSFGDDDAD